MYAPSVPVPVYPYPPPYAPPPAYVRPQPPRTPQGVRWSFIAFLLYLAFLAMAVVFGILLFQLIGSFSGTPDPARLVASAISFLAVAVVLGLLGLLVLVFYLLGFGYLYGGRNEFGPTHARNVRLALYLLIAALIVEIAGAVVGFALGTAAVRTLPGGVRQVDPGAYYLVVAAGGIVGVVVAALVAGMLVLSVRALAQPKHQRLLYAAAGLGTATPGMTSALTLLQLPQFLSLLQASLDAQNPGTPFAIPAVDPSVGIPVVVGAALGLVTFALYAYVFRDVGGRLRSGELKSILPPPAPVPAWMPGPVAPPYGGPAYPGVPYPTAPPSPPPQGPSP